LLEEGEGITLSQASIRRMLQEAGVHVVVPSIGYVARGSDRKGNWCPLDGSPHACLEERGPRLSLIGGRDDATGKVVGAVCGEQED